MAMEGFSELIRRLNDAHEREVEGLREKIQELTNKKGGDCKRMEELFNRNQQLREQQRLLTDNIKQLENRLRAGLCDRCSVTQDVARRRQQEYESSQIQSLQHISLLAAEVSVLKQGNRRLREDLRAVQESQGGSSSQDMTSEVRQSPDLSPPATPLVNAGCKSRGLPVKGNGAMKTELDQTDACATEAEQSHQCGWTGRQSLNSYKPLPLAREAPPPWRTELGGAPARAVERRTQSLDIIRQSPIALSIPSHLLLSRSALSSSSLPGQDKSSRHQVLVPVPYRPRPLAPSLTLPWPLAPPPDWAPREGVVVSPKPSSPRFPSLHTSRHPTQAQQGSPGRRSPAGQGWPLHCPLEPGATLGREQGERGGREQGSVDVKVAALLRSDTVLHPETALGERLGKPVMTDGPLDLSGRGKSKMSQSPQENKPRPSLQERSREEENLLVTSPSPSSSPRPPTPPSSSSTPPAGSSPSANQSQQQNQQNNKHQGEGLTGSEDLSAIPKDKKIPVLTISLRPVVLLDTLHCSLKRQDHHHSPDLGRSQKEAAGEGDRGDRGRGGEERDQTSQSTKRTREELDSDWDLEAVQKERKVRVSPASTEQE